MAGKCVILGAMAAGLFLSACGGGEPNRLMNLRPTHAGPDEFSILPTKPLQIPSDLTNLPTPTPGGSNLVDQNPLADAVIALGGRPGAGTTDPALIAAATRNGVSPTIRGDLAREDAEFRAKQSPSLLERLFGTSTYHRVYADQTVNSGSELERWRQVDRRTPSAPPTSR